MRKNLIVRTYQFINNEIVLEEFKFQTNAMQYCVYVLPT